MERFALQGVVTSQCRAHTPKSVFICFKVLQLIDQSVYTHIFNIWKKTKPMETNEFYKCQFNRLLYVTKQKACEKLQ